MYEPCPFYTSNAWRWAWFGGNVGDGGVGPVDVDVGRPRRVRDQIMGCCARERERGDSTGMRPPRPSLEATEATEAEEGRKEAADICRSFPRRPIGMLVHIGDYVALILEGGLSLHAMGREIGGWQGFFARGGRGMGPTTTTTTTAFQRTNAVVERTARATPSPFRHFCCWW